MLLRCGAMETPDQTQLGNTSYRSTGSLLLTPYLCVVNPVHANLRVRLQVNQRLVVGRDHNADLVLDSDRVSRQHCLVGMNSDGQFYVEDLGSTNGTRVDGEKVTTTVITPASRLSVDAFQLKIEYKHAEEIAHEQQLLKAATSDALTGIANRAWFFEQANNIVSQARISGQDVSIIMLDIDKFKTINDLYGHPTGDSVIRGVAKVLEESIRQQDVIARYGGEEFVVCLPGNDLESGFEFCERVRKQVEKVSFRFSNQTFKVTISLGLCTHSMNEFNSVNKLVALADKALYLSKENGRNRTSVFQQSLEMEPG